MKLKIGDSVPKFSLKDQDNQLVNSTDFIGKNAMVIYFYPKDDTPGCTKQACKFRDEFEAFTDLDVKVIGISADDVASHKNFAKKYNLPFTLLADTENKVRKLFGVPQSMLGLIPGRVTYVINKEGTVIHTFNSQFGAEKHITETLTKLKEQ
ncbi:peroxiredoxin [Aureibaculum conchae]|uniref:peroxiredoxin n=1 Tax=Aureibaculum sp. 2308TA14-22 TaxID=3108392 RepID=UPI00339794E8